jgi:hypothetical protein
MGIELRKKKLPPENPESFLELQDKVLGSARERGVFGSVDLTPFEKALEEVTGRATVIEGQKPVLTLKELIEGPRNRPLATKGGIPSPEFLLPPRTRQNTISSQNTISDFSGNLLDMNVSMDNVGRDKVIRTLTDRILNDFTLEQIVDTRRAAGDVDKDFKEDMNFLTGLHGAELTKKKIIDFFAGRLATTIVGVDLYGEKF